MPIQNARVQEVTIFIRLLLNFHVPGRPARFLQSADFKLFCDDGPAIASW